MLGETTAHRVLEVGPDLGCVTAVIENAGYDMGTLDFQEQAFSSSQVPHISQDLRTVLRLSQGAGIPSFAVTPKSVSIKPRWEIFYVCSKIVALNILLSRLPK